MVCGFFVRAAFFRRLGREGASPAGFLQGFSGLPTRSSRRHRLEAGVAVVANQNPWEAAHG